MIRKLCLLVITGSTEDSVYVKKFDFLGETEKLWDSLCSLLNSVRKFCIPKE